MAAKTGNKAYSTEIPTADLGFWPQKAWRRCSQATAINDITIDTKNGDVKCDNKNRK